MNIGIDITSIIYRRGVSRYTSNLVKALAKHTSHNLHLYGSSLRQNSLLKEESKRLLNNHRSDYSKHILKTQPFPPTLQQILWKLGLNPINSVFPKIDVFHSWDWLQPPDKDLPLVSTIHDLAILRYPETAHPKILSAHKRSWQVLKERGAHIIAVSHATKKDIVELLEIPNWRVHVIPEALPIELQEIDHDMTEERQEIISQELKLQRPYILFVGIQEPRKNLERLIEAWQPLANEIELIIAGDQGWQQSDHSNQHLRFLGRVTDEQLSVLYAQAELLAYPSLYEGFGLPILEAFQHGTPVITSDISAMIEVAGNAAELVNPLSVDSIRGTLKTVLSESKEQQQHRLQRMIIRKQMFSWEKVAKQTAQVYQQAISQKV